MNGGFMSWYRMQPPALRALLTINVAAYVLWALIFVHIASLRVLIVEHLALNPAVSNVLFQPWQLVTYNFLHLSPGLGGFLHILFNMLWLVWIGREFEQLHGSHRLLAVYLISGVGGGLLTMLWYAVFPAPAIVYGASASVLGVLTAVAIFYPFKSIALLFIPFPIRLIHLVLAFLVLDLLLIAGSNTAVAAHAGGALFGFLYAKGERSGMDLSSWAGVFFRSRRSHGAATRKTPTPARTPLFGTKKKQSATSARAARITPMPQRDERAKPTSSTSSEIDRILDKISAEGYEALTNEEKRLLYEASKREG